MALETLELRDVPATFLVTNGDDSGPGSLRAAVETASSALYMNVPNEIIIDDAVAEIELESSLEAVNSALLVISPESAAAAVSIEPVEGQEHEFRFLLAGFGNQGHFELRSLTINHFGSNDNGGAILFMGSELTLKDCFLAGNQAGGNGGAIAATGLSLTLVACNFGAGTDFPNVAGGHGGAVFFMPNGGVHDLTITDSFFFYNSSGGKGGAVYSRTTGETSITSSGIGQMFAFNQSGDLGSAVYHELGTLTIAAPLIPGAQPQIAENFGPGGAVYTHSASLVLIDATIVGNDPKDLIISAAALYSVNFDRIGEWAIV